MAQTKINYPKHWVDIPAQIAVLESRGLSIGSRPEAEKFLSYINYYRFTGYCLRLKTKVDATGEHCFAEGTRFEDVVALCEIDKALRDVFANALELIEISVRASVADVIGRAYDAFGHLDQSHFVSSFTVRNNATEPSQYDVWRKKLQSETRRSRELFITHFEKTYVEYPDLPIWMTCEVSSFGSISKLYDNLLKSEMRSIASRYGLQSANMASFLHAFVYLRNVCAHHSRLWDKSLSIKPMLPVGKLWDPIRTAPQNSVFVGASAIYWMLGHDSISAAARESWRDDLKKAIGSLGNKFPHLMRFTGFPADWQELALWK